MGFEANAREMGAVTVIDARGNLAAGVGGTVLRDILHVLVNKGQKKFLLNLAGVNFIDSFGIGELARSYATVRRRGGELKLLHVTETVHHVLQITRLVTLFEIHTDEQTAIGRFA